MSLNPGVIIGGAWPKNKRKDRDFYSTPIDCTKALLTHASGVLEGTVWEPACGDGAITRVLEEAGRVVVSSDKYETGFGENGIDFLETNDLRGECIITNPPFSLAAQFIAKARSFNVPFALRLKSDYWHAANRAQLFKDTGPYSILAMTWRPVFSPEAGPSPTMNSIWTVWERTPLPSCIYKPVGRG